MVYSRRCESRRSRTRRYEKRREVVCGGGVLDSLQSNSFSLVEPLCSSLPVIYSLSLSLSLSSFLSPRRRSRLKTRSKSRRRVASSRFGDSKEGSFLFPTLYRCASVFVAMPVCSDYISRPLMTTSPVPA